jgi:hypothetical protein
VAYLPKPFSAASLIGAIEKTQDTKDAARASLALQASGDAVARDLTESGTTDLCSLARS